VLSPGNEDKISRTRTRIRTVIAKNGFASLFLKECCSPGFKSIDFWVVLKNRINLKETMMLLIYRHNILYIYFLYLSKFWPFLCSKEVGLKMLSFSN